MEHGTLQDALKAQGWLGLAGIVCRQFRRGFFQELAHFLPELIQVAAAGTQHLGSGRIADQGIEQMLHCHELVVFLTGLLEGQVQGEFQFLAQHICTSNGQYPLDFFHTAQQWMLMTLRIFINLRNLGLGNFVCVDTTHALALAVYHQHDAGRLLPVHTKQFLQQGDDKLHRCEVVIQKKHLVHRWFLELRFCLFKRQPFVATMFLIFTHCPVTVRPKSCG